MRRHLRLLVAIDLALVVLSVAALLWWRSPLHAAPAFTIHKVEDAAFAPTGRTEPFFVLLIGNDARPGLEGIRGDALHIVGVNPAAGTATVVNIPRDTYVDIPGLGQDKINDAYDQAGFAKQVETVAAFTGVPLSFVVETSFEGFEAMVDDMGGLHIEVPFRMLDSKSGADFHPGRTHLNGRAALAYARNRNLPDGDLSRTTNQGWLLIAGLERAREVGKTPFDTMRMLGVMARHTRMEGVAVRELYQLVSLGLTIDPANVRNATMPSVIGKVGPADVVFAAPEAGAFLADFRDDAILQSF